ARPSADLSMLTIGTRIGVYEIVAPLGAGGMGEVFRARDTKLRREVAIKILPEVFAADPDRVSRFQREAELLAALNIDHVPSALGHQARSRDRFRGAIRPEPFCIPCFRPTVSHRVLGLRRSDGRLQTSVRTSRGPLTSCRTDASSTS